MSLPRVAVILLALCAGCGDGHLGSAPRAAASPRPASPDSVEGPVAAPSAPGEPGREPGPAVDRAGASPSAAPTGPLRAPRPDELARYRWLAASDSIRALDEVVAPPKGFTRVALAAGTFGAFLRSLPLRAPGSSVHSYDGSELGPNDDARITAVVALDPGTRDLQQCADTAIRLHAEWLWAAGREKDIGYHFTSGDLSTWAAYAAGDRPIVEARSVAWARRAQPSAGHTAFRSYLDQVFMYAGTVSLAREAAPVERKDLAVGDVLVLPGGPGHTIVILDLAVDGAGHRRALLGQGFMPAQEAHVLASERGEPWFDLDGDSLRTPFWPAPFPWSSLRRMRTASGHTE